MSKKSTKKDQEKSHNKPNKQRPLKWQIGGLIILIIAGGIGFYTDQQSSLPGEKIENLGQDHVSANYPFQYNSSPPTSGPHAGPTSWGEHSNEIPEVNQVHNLEHGGILIQYNCAHLPADQSCNQLRSELRQVLKKGRKDINHKMILAPYSKMSHLIATTAWTRLQYFETVDEEGILSFAESLIDQAPEFFK